MELYSQIAFEQLEKELPLLITRQEDSRLLGGLFTPESLRNLDSINKGPQVKIRFGKKIAYEKNSFIHWLKNYRIKQSNRFQAKRKDF